MTRTQTGITIAILTPILAVALILVVAQIAHYRDAHPSRGCVDVRSTPMGTVMDLQAGAYSLRWDDKCPSGVGWTSK